MPCYTDYIGIDRSATSRSGLYASDLPGVELSMLSGLTKDDQGDYVDLFEMIEQRAWSNLVSDVSLALQAKFFVNKKLVSRETSEFKEAANGATGLSGIKIKFNLPKYARIHILSVEVFSEQEYASPGSPITIYRKDENGEILFQTDQSIDQGRNVINIDQDFEADELYIAYDPDLFSFRQTENKYYNSTYSKWDVLDCIFPCWGDYSYQGQITQVNGGGLNVKYVIHCSPEKFVCENLNLFRAAYWYRIGVELADEQLLGNRLNRFTTMTAERAEDRSGYFGTKYTSNVSEAVQAIKITEDPICFTCKNTVMAKTVIP